MVDGKDLEDIKIKPLVIFDRSGSMDTELMGSTRYNICKKIVEKFDIFDLWWFGDDVEIKNDQKIIIDVPCDQGTDIPNMLRQLITYLKGINDAYVVLLTDDECEYDPQQFKIKFKELSDNNYYIVYDVCGTNMEKLNTVFGGQANITKDINIINNLINELKNTINKEKTILEKINGVGENLKIIKENLEKLSQSIGKIEIERERINEELNSCFTTKIKILFNGIFKLNKYIKSITNLIKENKEDKNKFEQIEIKIKETDREIKELIKDRNMFDAGKDQLTENKKKYFDEQINKKNNEKKIYEENLENLKNANNSQEKELNSNKSIINILSKVFSSFFKVNLY